MSENAPNTTRLQGGLAHTASWVRILDDGSIEAECFDHSPQAEQWFGNDVAFLLRVAPEDTDRLLGALAGEKALGITGVERNNRLLQAAAERFSDYFALKQWLDEQGIPYTKDFEPRA
jgi:hypothetical protein